MLNSAGRVVHLVVCNYYFFPGLIQCVEKRELTFICAFLSNGVGYLNQVFLAVFCSQEIYLLSTFCKHCNFVAHKD